MAAPHEFALDRFQLDAIAALDRGESVLVSAPTGAGKTVVADAAIDMALAAGGKAFYTTPIKALSNQKFGDLRRRLGADRVGLLTGDNSINGEAPVVVMTTEVLRNMIYAGSEDLDGLHVVVLDEVHYLQDTYRGPVWEEVIIHLPDHVRLVGLSATISNAEEVGSWLGEVRGRVATVVETERPVELHALYLVEDRTAEAAHLLPILGDGRANPEGHRFTEDPRVARRHGGRLRRRYATPRRIEVVERLDDEGMLPAIYFIFSRNGCEEALATCRDAGLRFTTREERQRIRELIDERTGGLGDDDLDLLGFDIWSEALQMGLAAHHAGMVPAFKETVEACFAEGLVRVVFATETLALGVNMPARSVVIEKLTKYTGDTHELLTPGEFTQLTGRAGRRGIDDVGYAAVLWSPFVSFDQVASLAASRSFPLRSAFRPTYNMVANLVRRCPRSDAVRLLGQSFAQYQADRASVGLRRRLHRDEQRRAELEAEARCDLGDAAGYLELRRRRDAERRQRPGSRRSIDESLALLRPGDVVWAPVEPPVPVVLISVAVRGRSSLRLRGVDREGQVVQFDGQDVEAPLRAQAEVPLPVPYAPGERSFRLACAEPLRALERGLTGPAPAAPTEASPLDAPVAAHPVGQCPDRDRHVRALEELERLEREMADVRAAADRRHSSIVRRFDEIVALLEARDYVAGWSLTGRGRRLAAVYHECDLAVAEALDAGLLDGLEPFELAGVVSCFTFEERRRDAPAVSPAGRAGARVRDVLRLAEELRDAERAAGIPPMRPLDTGFATIAEAWAAGRPLSGLLDDDLSAGDFVRNVKVLVDLLSQLAQVAQLPATRAAADGAARALLRGVVAASSDVTPAPR